MKRWDKATAWISEHGAITTLILVISALSFSHIRDLALHHGQQLWQADLYPVAVDAVTAYALRKIREPALSAWARVVAWIVFALFCGVSLAANLLDAPAHDVTGYFVAVLPAAALVSTTALGHLHGSTKADAPPVEQTEIVVDEKTAATVQGRPKATTGSSNKRATQVIVKALEEFKIDHPNGTGPEFASFANAMLLASKLPQRTPRTLQNAFYAARQKPAAQAASIN